MKRFILIVLSVVMLALTACAGKETEISSESNSGETEITDQMGRNVVISKSPERIVSAYYITSSMLIALGLDDKMVGIEENPQKRAVYGLSNPKLLDLPTVGSLKAFDTEKCVSLEPDLVIVPMKLKDVVPTFEELGITVIVVNPESPELLAEMIDIVGKATGTSEKAQKLNDYVAAKTEMLNEINSKTEAVSVYLGGNSNFLLTAGKSMYQAGMIELAGGSNVANEIEDTYWAEVSYEQILDWNPEYIILASAADYTVEDVLNDPNLSECDAVKNGNVYHIPDDIEAWDSPVPGAFLGSLWLETIIHSDEFNVNDFNEIVGEYYETFYNFKAEQ